jgi:hypothetical protein
MGLWKFCAKCVFLSAVVSLLYGCPYDSAVPLNRSEIAQIDKGLIGNWLYKSNDQKESGIITIFPFNESELLIVMREEGKRAHDFYRAFVSIVDGEKFLNVQEIKPTNEKRSWIFVNYSIFNGELTIRIVEDKLFKDEIASSSALNDFIKENITNRDLYGSDGGTVMKFVPVVSANPDHK